jgi:hypothetical protein
MTQTEIDHAADLLAWSRKIEEHRLTFDEWVARPVIAEEDLAVAA